MSSLITEKKLLFSNGNVFISFFEDQNGYKQGIYKKYFYELQTDVEEVSFYQDNLLHGEQKKYKLVDGKLILILSCNYYLGNLDGMYREWYSKTSIPYIQCNYKDGKIDGLYEEWHPDGNVHIKNIYSYDKLMPGSKSWFSSLKTPTYSSQFKTSSKRSSNNIIKSEFIDFINTTYKYDGTVESKSIYDKEYNLIRIIKYYYNNTVESESEIKNGKNVKTIFYKFEPEFNWGTRTDKINKIITIVDHEKQTKIIITPRDKCKKTYKIYPYSEDLIKKEYIDNDGNVLPSMWESFKNCFKNKPKEKNL